MWHSNHEFWLHSFWLPCKNSLTSTYLRNGCLFTMNTPLIYKRSTHPHKHQTYNFFFLVNHLFSSLIKNKQNYYHFYYAIRLIHSTFLFFMRNDEADDNLQPCYKSLSKTFLVRLCSTIPNGLWLSDGSLLHRKLIRHLSDTSSRRCV